MDAKKARELFEIGSGKRDLTDEPIGIREYEFAKGYLAALEGPEVRAKDALLDQIAAAVENEEALPAQVIGKLREHLNRP